MPDYGVAAHFPGSAFVGSIAPAIHFRRDCVPTPLAPQQLAGNIRRRDYAHVQRQLGMSLVLPCPVGVVQGDTMFALVAHRAAAVDVAPAGWTLLTSEQVVGHYTHQVNQWHQVWVKVAGAGEPADYTWTFTTNSARSFGGISAYYHQGGAEILWEATTHAENYSDAGPMSHAQEVTTPLDASAGVLLTMASCIYSEFGGNEWRSTMNLLWGFGQEYRHAAVDSLFIAPGTLEHNLAHHSLRHAFATTTLALYAVAPAITELEGHVPGSALLSGDVSVRWTLQGAVGGAADLTGSMAVPVGLAGHVEASATVVGDLAVLTALAGAVTGTAVLTGALEGNELAGAVTGTGVLSGDLGILVGLEGAVTATAVLGGTLVGNELVGHLAPSVALTGLMGARVVLAGAVVGSATITGAVTHEITLAGAVLGEAQLAGTVRYVPTPPPDDSTLNARLRGRAQVAHLPVS